jgi:hypothetical protein
MAQFITVKDAAERMGKSQMFIRAALRAGLLPIGVAVKTSSRYTYYISPKLLDDFVGRREEAAR